MKDGLTDTQKDIMEAVAREIPRVLKLPEPDRSKCILCLSYEYFLQDAEEKAFALLEKADPGYFQNHLNKDMEADPSLTRLVMTIISKLIESGYVKVKGAEKKG